MIFIGSFAFSADQGKTSLKFERQVLCAAEVVKIAEEYLKIGHPNYRETNYLSSISFTYTSENGLSFEKGARWYLNYECMPRAKNEPVAIGCGFSLSISDQVKPSVQYFPGH